jgi:hypothetical protein
VARIERSGPSAPDPLTGPNQGLGWRHHPKARTGPFGRREKGIGVDQRYVGAGSARLVERASAKGAHRSSRGCRAALALSTLALATLALAARADAFVYWTSGGVEAGFPGGVGRANLDGTQLLELFETASSDPTGLAVDGAPDFAPAGHIYWVNQPNPRTGTAASIGRANLDGTGVDQSFIPNPGSRAGWRSMPLHVAPIQRPVDVTSIGRPGPRSRAPTSTAPAST